MNRIARPALALFLPLALLFASATALAQEACINDDDCPGLECGGDVCQWLADGNRCMPPGSMPEGQDGWCETDEDCKCRDQGATCVAARCTFVTPRPGTGGGAGSGGGAATGGSAGSGGAQGTDDGGCALAAAPSSSGAPAWVLVAGLLLLMRRRGAR